MSTLMKLRAIHRKVIKNFTYKTDTAQYGMAEKWVMPPEDFSGFSTIVGDCEDFALACRKLAREADLRSRLIYCTVANGSGHCVLEVDGYILDNNESKVRTREDMSIKGYKWIAISGYNSGDKWFKIKNK